MTYRERRERKADRLRGWADKRKVDAAQVFKAGAPFTGDIAFNTQPGHIPFRAKLIAREDRAFESVRKADSMEARASGIERQLDASIYSDDADAIERLKERLAEYEAKRERIKAYNASCRRGARDFALLNEEEKKDIATVARVAAYSLGKKGEMPGYVLTNLGGNITRTRQRIAQLERVERLNAMGDGTTFEQLAQKEVAVDAAVSGD